MTDLITLFDIITYLAWKVNDILIYLSKNDCVIKEAVAKSDRIS